MKHIKSFDELNEGKGRYTIKGNMASVGTTGLPQFWSMSPDYKKEDDTKPQKMGLNSPDLIAQPGNDYSYLTDIDDHIDTEDVKKLVEPHVKKFNDFGFNPSEKTSKKK
jgi:hypothetical protein